MLFTSERDIAVIYQWEGYCCYLLISGAVLLFTNKRTLLLLMRGTLLFFTNEMDIAVIY